MIEYTTGAILNTGSRPAAKVSVTFSNESEWREAIVGVELFVSGISATGSEMIPIALQLFSINPETTITKTFDVAHDAAYEFHFRVRDDDHRELVINTFAFSAYGEPLSAERVLQSETTEVHRVHHAAC